MGGFEFELDAGANAIVRLRRGDSAKTQKAEIRIGNAIVKTIEENEQYAIPAVTQKRILSVTPVSFRAGNPRGPSKWKKSPPSQTFHYPNGGVLWLYIQHFLKIEDRTDDDWDDGFIDIEIARRLSGPLDEQESRKDSAFIENGGPLFIP